MGNTSPNENMEINQMLPKITSLIIFFGKNRFAFPLQQLQQITDMNLSCADLDEEWTLNAAIMTL